MKKRISLKDISNKVGVSVSLVSYVLNDKGKEYRVSEETSRKILDAAKELGYVPNQIARSLKSNKSNSIGLIVADISNPFFSSLARTIEDEASLMNYTVIFGSSDESLTKFSNVLEFLTTRQVDGFIIAPTEGSREAISMLKEHQIPFVLIDRYFEDLDTNYVIIDNFQASYEATNYLISKGKQKIGIVAYESDLIHYQNRVDGYIKALSDHGMEVKPRFQKRVRYTKSDEEIGIAVSDLVNKEFVDGILFCTNSLALGGLKKLLSMGVEIQKDLDVVFYDQTEGYEFFPVPIPYIKQPISNMAKEAVRILLDQVQSNVRKVSKVHLKASLQLSVPTKTKVLE